MPLPPLREDPSPTSTILPNTFVQFLFTPVEEVGWIRGEGAVPLEKERDPVVQ